MVMEECTKKRHCKEKSKIIEKNGETIVEDDFQLICFDMVSEPSTPNAFLSPERGAGISVSMPGAIQNYMAESKTSTKKVDLLIDSILRDKK